MEGIQPNLATLAQRTCTLDSFQFSGVILPKLASLAQKFVQSTVFSSLV